MKTPQQLSEEVLQKISARKEKEKRIYRNAARVGAILLITAVIVPLSLLFNDNLIAKDLTANNGAGGTNAAGNATNTPSLKPDFSFSEDLPSDEGVAGTTSASSQQKPDNGFQDEAENGTENDAATENTPGQMQSSEEYGVGDIESWEETEADSSSDDSSTDSTEENSDQ